MRNPPGVGDHLAKPRLRSAIWVGLALLILCSLSIVYWPFRAEKALLHVTFEGVAPIFNALDVAYSSAHDLAPGDLRISSAGSVEKAYALAQGLIADTVCLATPAEMNEVLRKVGSVSEAWQERFPNRSSPFYSTIVLIVRKGNPRSITRWEDLFRPDVSVAVASPRIGGAGCYTYLALLGHQMEANGLGEAAAAARVQELYLRARILNFSSRRAFDYFARERSIDVFPTWESEGLRIQRESPDDFEVIYPPTSILAEPVVAILEEHAGRRGTLEEAEQFIRFLYSEEGQAIIAHHGLRPRLPSASQTDFPDLDLRSVESIFGSWESAWKTHFARGGAYEMIQIMRGARKGGSE